MGYSALPAWYYCTLSFDNVIYMFSFLPLPPLQKKMVVYEAARAMVNLKNVTAREVQPAVSGMYVFSTHQLSSLLKEHTYPKTA